MTDPAGLGGTAPIDAPSSAAVIGVVGIGATGARAARQLAAADDVADVVLAGTGARPTTLDRALGTAARLGDPLAGADAVVLAGPSGTQADTARAAVARGIHVVATSDDPVEVEALLDLDRPARDAGVRVVVGAAFAPGLSCVLARHAAGWVDEVTEIHVARFGTGGPACARAHHRALRSFAREWRGEFLDRPGGSGRELVVFPEPVGSLDSYRAGLVDPVLLHRAMPDVSRIRARQAANRRARLTAWLPMLRRPHPEGRIGAVSVEIRGRRGTTTVTELVGAIDRPAVAAGAVAGLAARWAVAGRLPVGAHGLAAVDDTTGFLSALSTYGVRAARFVGTT